MATTTTEAAPVSSKGKVFVRRLLSFVGLWSIVLAVTGLLEFYGLVEKRDLVCFKGWGIFGGLLLMVGTFLNLTGRVGTSGSPARVNDFETSFLILFVLGLCLRQFFSRSNTAGILAISTTLFGLMYVPWLLNFIQKINFFPRVEGHYYLLYFVLVTKFSDMGAYSVGSLIGRHKMIPRISPGKTWEGFGGAVVTSILASVLFVHFLADRMSGMNYLHAIVLGIILSIGAVVGDLIESIFK